MCKWGLKQAQNVSGATKCYTILEMLHCYVNGVRRLKYTLKARKKRESRILYFAHNLFPNISGEYATSFWQFSTKVALAFSQCAFIDLLRQSGLCV